MSDSEKPLTNRSSQSVRLPLDFRIEDSEILSRHRLINKNTLSPCKPADWQGLIDVVKLNAEEDLLIERRQAKTRPNAFENTQE